MQYSRVYQTLRYRRKIVFKRIITLRASYMDKSMYLRSEGNFEIKINILIEILLIYQ